MNKKAPSAAEDGGRIDLIPPGRSSIEEGDLLLGSFTNEKLLYAVASPTVVGTGQALSLRARTGYTGVSVSTCVAPHRTELIHA